MEYVVSTSATYDKLILPGFDEAEVTWDVFFYAQETQIVFTIPYMSDGELLALNATIEQVATIEPDTNSSGGVETQLVLPDFSVSPCIPSPGMHRRVHVTVPRRTRSICFGEGCRVVLCPVGSPWDSESISSSSGTNFIPANNKLYFGNNASCVIESPPSWSDFVDAHFGNHTPFLTDEDWYTMDMDGDG
jgi:hypothetical protein